MIPFAHSQIEWIFFHENLKRLIVARVTSIAFSSWACRGCNQKYFFRNLFDQFRTQKNWRWFGERCFQGSTLFCALAAVFRLPAAGVSRGTFACCWPVCESLASRYLMSPINSWNNLNASMLIPMPSAVDCSGVRSLMSRIHTGRAFGSPIATSHSSLEQQIEKFKDNVINGIFRWLD